MFPWTAVAVIGGIALLWNGMIWRALVVKITEVDVFDVRLQQPFAETGAVLAYLAAAMLLNRTHIEIGDELLSIRHGPLKLPSVSRTWLHVADIRRVYVGQE